MPERLLPWLRGLFLVAVLAFAWLGLRGRTAEIGDALAAVSPASVLLALALVLLGLACTGLLWRRILAALGHPLPVRDGLAIFFVGQLGKYIPGSVWSLGAHATLARRHAVPARATVRAGLVFLGYHLLTGVLLGGAAVLLGALESPWPTWLTLLAVLAALALFLPPIARRLGLVACLAGVLWLAPAWAAYTGALVLLVPTHPWPDAVALGGAFALAYAVGVVVVLAPAGVGAREALFVVLLAPLLGVPEATALALLARVVHTFGDGLSALAWWAAARRPRTSAAEAAMIWR